MLVGIRLLKYKIGCQSAFSKIHQNCEKYINLHVPYWWHLFIAGLWTHPKVASKIGNWLDLQVSQVPLSATLSVPTHNFEPMMQFLNFYWFIIFWVGVIFYLLRFRHMSISKILEDHSYSISQSLDNSVCKAAPLTPASLNINIQVLASW